MCTDFSSLVCPLNRFLHLPGGARAHTKQEAEASRLLTENQPFYLLLLASPVVNVFVGSKIETHGLATKNEMKTAPGNLGYTFSRTEAT